MYKKLSILSLVLFLAYRFWIHDVVEIPPHVQQEMKSLVEGVQEIKIPHMWGRVMNPGVVAEGDGYLMVFRADSKDFWSWVQRRLKIKRKTYMGFIELDREFKPKGEANYHYRTSLLPQEGANMGEDPRLIEFEGKRLVFYNDIAIDPIEKVLCKKMHMAEVIKKEGKYYLENIQVLYFPEGKDYEERGLIGDRHVEKNWSPFVYKGELYLIYVIEPLVLLKLNRETGECTRLLENEHVEIWPYGAARGGTPAIHTDGGYLSLFHSSFKGYKKGWQWRGDRVSKKPVYIFGAYLFEDEAPFRLKAFTAVPWTGKGLYNKAKKIVYPTSLLEQQEAYLLFFGKDDATIHVAKIPKSALRESLRGWERGEEREGKRGRGEEEKVCLGLAGLIKREEKVCWGLAGLIKRVGLYLVQPNHVLGRGSYKILPPTLFELPCGMILQERTKASGCSLLTVPPICDGSPLSCQFAEPAFFSPF